MRCRAVPILKEEADSSTGCLKKKNKSHAYDMKYSMIHLMGYFKSWDPSKESLKNESESDSDSCNR